MVFAIPALSKAKTLDGDAQFIILRKSERLAFKGLLELESRYNRLFISSQSSPRGNAVTVLKAKVMCVVVVDEFGPINVDEKGRETVAANTFLFARPWKTTRQPLVWTRATPLDRHIRKGVRLLSGRELVPATAPDRLPHCRDEILALVGKRRYFIKIKVEKQ